MSREYGRLSKALDDAWDILSCKWSADIKRRYYDQILQPMIDLADEVYDNNTKLEQYSDELIRALAGGEEERYDNNY